MNRDRNIEIARDTLDIIESGYYKLKSGEKVSIYGAAGIEREQVGTAEVLSPAKLNAISAKLRDTDASSASGAGCSMYVVDADSFEAAERFSDPLVMNFASAKHPGGGFLTGASAQEASLCRCSTLYASLTSETASEMYKYNRSNALPAYSDHMIFSKKVCVFRKRSGEYLRQPFAASVMTIAAPNVYGPASVLSADELRGAVMRRLEYFLCACAEYGCRELVLGAWGCGAFGNDPYMIAGCFRELLVDRKMESFFDNIAFAIIGERNLEAFRNVFRDSAVICGSVGDIPKK